MSAETVFNDTCLLCESTGVHPALSLTPTPPANALEGGSEPGKLVIPSLGKPTPVFRLDVYLCQDCGHLQLGCTVDPEVLFRNYTYVSPPGMLGHWKLHAAQMLSRFQLRHGDLVVEIGSNNGDLLSFYRDAGMRVLGFEPATKIAAAATNRGVPTVTHFFGTDALKAMNPEVRHTAKLVLANNVFAHIRDLRDVVEGVKTILADDGIFIFEVQYRADMLKQNYFDMVYHEHLHYHAVGPLQKFLASCGLHLFDVQSIDTHGGSIRCFAERKTQSTVTQPALLDTVASESALLDMPAYRSFAERIETARYDFRQLLDAFLWGMRNGGGAPKVAVLGAPAKLTTLAYHFGLDEVEYVCDDAVEKQGKLTPGKRWPIVPFDRLLEEPVDLAIVGAWNYADGIMQRVKTMFAEKGRPAPRFLIPFPTPRIVI